MPVALATCKAETGRTVVDKPGQIVHETLSPKYSEQDGCWWLTPVILAT
jgi:hypothetical protein